MSIAVRFEKFENVAALHRSPLRRREFEFVAVGVLSTALFMSKSIRTRSGTFVNRVCRILLLQ
jgi:hypothetical protein